MTFSRKWIAPVWLAMLVALGVLLSPAIASAHAELRDTDPGDGAVLETAPASVTLSFNEAVEVLPDAMQLYHGNELVGTLDATTSGPEVVIALPDDLDLGTYTVGWRVISADSHPVSGALTFSIGHATAAPADIAVTESTPVMTVMGAVTGIAYLSLLLAVGILWFRAFIIRQVDLRSMKIAIWGTAVTTVAHLLLIPLTAIRDTGKSLGALVDAEMWKVDGLSLELRALIFVVVGLAFEIRYAPTAPERRLAMWGVSLGGLLALGSLTIVGHSTAIGPRWLMHGADFLHGAAGSFWFGGLIGLSLYLAMALRGRKVLGGPAPADAASVVARFSSWAGLGFAALAVSGVVMAVRILGSWEALLHTAYGKVLIAKVLIVLAPLGLAAWNKYKLVPAIEGSADGESAWGHLRTTVLAEAALLVVILGVTGFLVLQNPNLPETVAAEPVAEATLPYAETVPLGDGTLYVRVSPGDTGANDVTIAVMDVDGEPVELADHPQVKLTLPAQDLGPLTTMLEPEADPGHYAGSIDVPVAGDWTLEIVTRISKFEEPITPFQITFPHTGEATPVP